MTIGGTGNETDPQIQALSLRPQIVYVDVLASNVLLADGAVTEPLKTLLDSAIRQFVDLHVLNAGSTDLNAINGVMQSPALVSVTRSAGNTIASTDIAGMLARCLVDATDSLFFTCSPGALAQLFKIGSLEVQHRPQTGTKQFTLAGLPLHVHRGLPDLGVTGDIILANGAYYGMWWKMEPNYLVNSHVQFLKNQSIIRVLARVAGGPLVQSTVTPTNGSSLSPFVCLTA